MVRDLFWAGTGLSACDWLVSMAVLVFSDLTCVLHVVLDVSWTGALSPWKWVWGSMVTMSASRTLSMAACSGPARSTLTSFDVCVLFLLLVALNAFV